MKAALLLLLSTAAWAAPPARPVFQVPGVPNPTKDKPQSKLWYAHGSWWAWLPAREGSGVWQRTAAGWRRETRLDAALAGLPGQADVWAGGDIVRAVLVESERLAVAALRWDSALETYAPAGLPVRFAVPGGGLETATIDRDGRSRWWIAYASHGRMWVRASHDLAAAEWSAPHEVGELPASKDDICALAALPGAIGVIWSDQARDAVVFRLHRDDAAPASWDPVEVVARGNKTADDHFNMAAAPDGTLYVAAKNSVDTIGKPQLVLRVRDSRGRWTNHPYAVRTAEYQPSRPIVLLGGDPSRLFLLHSRYRMDRPVPPQSAIAWQSHDPARLDLAAHARTLIDAGIHVTDVTGCKSRLPAARPWIVLASDKAGYVYEARID
jgi:hypothetical protein